MLIRPDISGYSAPTRLAFFVLIMIVVMIIVSFIGVLLSIPFFHITLAQAVSGEAFIQNGQRVGILKYLQLVNQMGLFVFPPLLFAFFSQKSDKDFLCLRKAPTWSGVAIAGIALIAGLPLIDKLLQWNELMKLPSFLNGMEQWMKESEKNAAVITELFLKTNNIQGLAANLFIMALIPAIGEEFVFRGVLLKLLNEWTGKKALAIIISAIIFSAIHLQFYGFLPRFVLGVYLGYLYARSGSIWPSVFAHFVNNAITIVVAYLFFNGFIRVDYEKFGSSDNWFILLGSVAFTSGFLYLFYRLTKKKNNF